MWTQFEKLWRERPAFRLALILFATGLLMLHGR